MNPRLPRKPIPQPETAMRLAALILLSALPAHAQDLTLALPLDCTIGTDCFIEDYVDQDPAPGQQRDFACGFNARDDHRGTDIALLDFDAVASGTPVLAAAPGKVLRVRDGMADDRLMRGVTSQNACGNAVLIDHGGGWQTTYCHLRQGSVAVQSGAVVDTGTPLGMVGLSGQTNHPHLHLTVMKDGQTVDPFRPQAQGTCGETADTLWQDPPPYTRTGLVTAGFATEVPDFDAVRDGSARADRGAPDLPLVVYGYMAFAERGDILTLSAEGPDGMVFNHEILIKTSQNSAYQAFGKKPPAGGWTEGAYLGEALLTRKGQVIAHRFAHVDVLP